jgi:glycerophosphoryl diester phosphodiesterase
VSFRRVLAAGVAVGLLAPVTLLSPAEAVETPTSTAAAKKRLLSASVSPAVAGERVTFTARRPTAKRFRALAPKKQRTVRLVLQRRDGKAWRTVAKKPLKAKKQVRFTSALPAGAKGQVRYRTRAVVGKKTYAGGAVAVKVVAQRLAVQPSDDDADADITYAATLTPARAGRTVVVERYLDGAWSQVATASARATTVDLTVAAERYPAWYRVTATSHNGIRAVSSEPVRTTLDRVPTEIAHRAGAALAPEQTLAAMDAALAAGATSMEIDVQLTEDDVPIIVHDQTLARTTDVAELFPGRAGDPVGSFTLAEVKQLDAGSWFGEQWAGQRIPTLDEWIDAMGGRAHLVLEVKFWPNNTGTPEQQAAMRTVLDDSLATGSLGELAAAGKLTVSSFNHAFLKSFAQAHEDVPVGALTLARASATQLDDWEAWAEEVHANVGLATAADVAQNAARGLSTSLWTLQSPASYRKALSTGADGLITDHPGLLAEVLAPPAP